MAATAIESRNPERALAAHLVRRTSLSVDPRRVDQLADLSWNDAVNSVLDQISDHERGQADEDNRRRLTAPTDQDWTTTIDWWIDRMTEQGSGLRDRLAWFWHGLLTTNAYKVSDNALLARQLDHLRANGTGNFRTLLHGYVTGGALLDYLDASGSVASNPNENLARELMELFTIGRGHYSEDDVRAAARALSGWVVEDTSVRFKRENSFVAPLIFLGSQADWDTSLIIDRLCDHPATAARIAARLWDQLVGVPLTDEATTELGRWWQGQDLEITPLVARIISDQSFANSRYTRARGGLEWYCAARSVLGFENESWYLEHLGQMPYLPPSVAGWPDDRRWLSPGSLLARAGFVHNVDLGAILGQGETGVRKDRDHPGSAVATTEILDRCSLYEVSPQTVAAMDNVDRVADISPESAQMVRWRLALTSPEFNLS